MTRWLTAALAQNLNAILFIVGAAVAFKGLAQWSPAGADLFAGVLGMTIGAWPYLRLTRKP